MRIISTLLLVAGLGYGIIWLGKHHPEMGEHVFSAIQHRETVALKPHFSPEQVVDQNIRMLTRYNAALQGDPQVVYVPVLRLDIKYADTKYTTGEGTLLWDLSDGEMVLDVNTWQKSHGLADCIRAEISKQECKVLSLMARKGGQMGRESLRKNLNVDADLVDQWIDDCRRKKLMVPSGNGYRLHIQNPKLPLVPVTIMDTHLTTHGAKKTRKTAPRFNADEVAAFAEIYFGADFAIKNMEEVLLPVYALTTESVDGRLQTHFFNGITSREMSLESITY